MNPTESEHEVCPHGRWPGDCEDCRREKDNRFSEGRITEEEAAEYWSDPHRPLFTHELKRASPEGKEVATKFQIKGLTEELVEPLIREIAGAWHPEDLRHLRETLDKFFTQRRSGLPHCLNVEYYVATDEEDQPFAVTGLYSLEGAGMTGLKTKSRLNANEHHPAAGLGWFAVSQSRQGTGIGGYLLNWTEKLAAARGFKSMFIETDDYKNEKRANEMYRKAGFRQTFNFPEFYGPGRDLVTYSRRCGRKTGEPAGESVNPKAITAELAAELQAFAKNILSEPRFQEFQAALPSLIADGGGRGQFISSPECIVNRDANGSVESFLIGSPRIYENAAAVYWAISGDLDVEAQKRYSHSFDEFSDHLRKEVLIMQSDGANEHLEDAGFVQVGEEGIKNVFGKEDPTNYLFYIKSLTKKYERDGAIES